MKDNLVNGSGDLVNDCISRQAVEEMIKAEMPERGMWEIEGDKEKDTVCEVCADLIQELSKLPSVTPQPKMGHWKRISIDKYVQHATAYYKCSECGEDIIGEYNYCPNCGAKMQEVEE